MCMPTAQQRPRWSKERPESDALSAVHKVNGIRVDCRYRGTSLIRNTPSVGPCSTLYLRTCGDPRGLGVSYERGSPVLPPSPCRRRRSRRCAPGIARRSYLLEIFKSSCSKLHNQTHCNSIPFLFDGAARSPVI